MAAMRQCRFIAKERGESMTIDECQGAGDSEESRESSIESSSMSRESSRESSSMSTTTITSTTTRAAAEKRHAATGTRLNASMSWIQRQDFEAVYAGLSSVLLVYLRDEHGRKLRSCAEISRDLVVTASNVVASKAVCSDSTIILCFVPVAMSPRNKNISATFHVYFKEEEVSNSPVHVPLTPTSEAVAGCTRPGVSRITSTCVPEAPLLDIAVPTAGANDVDDVPLLPPRHAAHHDSSQAEGRGNEGGEGRKESGSSDKVYSSGSWLAHNLLTLNNVCLDRNHIIIFPPPGGGDFKNFTKNLSKWDTHPQQGEGRAGEEGGQGEEAGEFRTLSFGLHMWGLFYDRDKVFIPVRAQPGGFAAFAKGRFVLDDGAVGGAEGGGPGPVYLVPEGPTTHYGHMLTDSILPLFATVQLREPLHNAGEEAGVSAEEQGAAAPLPGWGLRRRRRRVILWPLKGNECPIKGQTVHSRVFWDLFAAISTHPRSDVVLLAQLLGGRRCFQELVIGQLIDQRIGYWQGSGLGFEPRTIPFIEEVGEAVSALRAGLLVSFKANASLLHASFHLHNGEQGGGSDGAGAEVAGGAGVGSVGRKRPHLTLLERANRRILNAAELVGAAEGVGFRVGTVDWVHLSLQEQVTWMQETDALCGMYGVGLIKMAFARPTSVLLEVPLFLVF